MPSNGRFGPPPFFMDQYHRRRGLALRLRPAGSQRAGRFRSVERPEVKPLAQPDRPFANGFSINIIYDILNGARANGDRIGMGLKRLIFRTAVVLGFLESPGRSLREARRWVAEAEDYFASSPKDEREQIHDIIAAWWRDKTAWLKSLAYPEIEAMPPDELEDRLLPMWRDAAGAEAAAAELASLLDRARAAEEVATAVGLRLIAAYLRAAELLPEAELKSDPLERFHVPEIMFRSGDLCAKILGAARRNAG